jgi:hypothetical protein
VEVGQVQARKRIGELLLERGVISVPQLEEGLALQRQTRQRLGVALIQKGFVTEEQLAQVLSNALSIPMVDLKGVTPEWSAIHMLRARFCESNDLFPFSLESSKGRKQLIVAMSDPLNLAAIEEIEFTTGLKCTVRMAPLSAIRAAILRYYHKVNPDDAPSGKMSLVQRGGGVRLVDTETHVEPPPAEEDSEVIVGEELPPEQREVTARTALAELMKQREQQKRSKGKPKPVADVSKDLDYLFGVANDEDAVEKLERKFWALLRVAKTPTALAASDASGRPAPRRRLPEELVRLTESQFDLPRRGRRSTGTC